MSQNLDWFQYVDLSAKQIDYKSLLHKRVKIVATIGPASEPEDVLRQMIRNGMDVARLNFSHGRLEDHKKRLATLRRIAKQENKHLGILQDIQGPKIRVGRFKDGPILLKKGQKFTITTDKVLGDDKRVSCTYGPLHQWVKAGHRILLDDGLIFLIVDKVKGRNIETTVLFGGPLKDSKGMNLPDTRIPISCLTPKDIKDLEFGLKNGVDFIALSFVQTADDVLKARRLIHRVAHPPAIVTKIESAHAVHDMENIIKVSDGIMIARGDLGVECPMEQVPALQKEMISAARRAGKFVITATQMLESMTSKPRPTRAEASDVANAVLDGTDAVMLSAETASGDFPVESVKTMSRIILRTEDYVLEDSKTRGPEFIFAESPSVTDAITAAAMQATESLDTSAIVAFTHSGTTPSAVSKLRPRVKIFALTPFERICRRLSVTWGVIPSLTTVMKHTDDMARMAKPVLNRFKLWKKGSHVVILSGTPVARPGSTNLLKIYQIKS